ncbi:MAG TPA: hydroxymethylbilane synthase [Gemmatimonadales bacterium]|nr:hydroxymethylbilane synthase [Gemmatimonadales bacterium]
MPLRIGTRGSALALWQTERVRACLDARGHATERIEIRTTGDVVSDVPLARIGSRALFTRQLDDALLEGRVDLAVHSLKDLPTTLPEGIAIAAVGLREDPRDALVSRGGIPWNSLPHGAVVATSSLRRRAQLLAARPDLTIDDIRGNVDTRLAKLDRSDRWAAIVLAVAGLARLGAEACISERLPLELMLPAPGQGALAATVRRDDAGAHAAAREAFHDRETALATGAERAVLRRLEGGCQVPVAAHARFMTENGGHRLELIGRVASLAGDAVVSGRRVGPADSPEEADALGIALADELLANGAAAILDAVRVAAASAPVPEP